MKYLKIKDSKGFYWNGDDYQEIDKINKDDLLVLLNAAEEEDFEIEEYDEEKLQHKAHQIIYGNLHNKLQQFLTNKNEFKLEASELYNDAIRKHSVDLDEESDEETTDD